MTQISAKRASSQTLAPVYMICAMLLVPVMDGTAKLLVAEYPLGQVVWARYFFHVLTLMPLFVLFGERPRLRVARPRLQLTRAFFLLGDSALFFAALFFIPLANGKAVFFVAPLIMTTLAPLILGEKVGPRRWTAVLIGFSGTLFILDLQGGGDFVGYLLAFGSATFYAIYLLLTRKLTAAASPLNTLLFTALVGTAVMTCLLPLGWEMPDARGWTLMVAVGLLGTLAHLLIIKAFSGGDASQLAPLTYAEIISASIFGLIVFGDFPALRTWIGIAIVVASGLFILRRQPAAPNI